MSFALTNPFESLFERGDIGGAVDYLFGNREAVSHLIEKYDRLLRIRPEDFMTLQAIDPNYKNDLMRKRELVESVADALREKNVSRD